MAERLTEGLWVLDLGLLPPLASNAYLLDVGDDVTLVDAGLGWNVPSLVDELADAGYAVADLDRVLVTHYDLDHVGGLRHVASALRCPVYVGRDDLRLVDGEDDPPLAHHKGAFHRVARALFPLPDAVETRAVTDGESVGGFTAYHTPGHNPGHTVYVHESGVAFLGDLVWEDDGGLTPPFWLDSYDMDELHRSIDGLVDRVQPFEVAAMGHGDPIRAGGRQALADLAARL
ncbi:MAG: MBL fold metallo-hydrolase [Haloarculaceae archaeon]